MGTRKIFTEAEIQALAKNPHTLSVTENRISFTLEAKRTILERYGVGKSMRQVIKDLGYDPEVLGKGWLKSIAKSIRRESESEQGLHCIFGCDKATVTEAKANRYNEHGTLRRD